MQLLISTFTFSHQTPLSLSLILPATLSVSSVTRCWKKVDQLCTIVVQKSIHRRFYLSCCCPIFVQRTFKKPNLVTLLPTVLPNLFSPLLFSFSIHSTRPSLIHSTPQLASIISLPHFELHLKRDGFDGGHFYKLVN